MASTIAETPGVLCKRDPEALDAIDRATAGRQGQRNDLFDNVQEVEAPTGNGSAAALRRLRKDRPDLHAEVLAGRRTAHGAMVEAGFRQKTDTVPLTVKGAVRLLKKLTARQRGVRPRCRVARYAGARPARR